MRMVEDNNKANCQIEGTTSWRLEGILSQKEARCRSVVKQAESQKQPGVLELWRAQRERLGGCSDLADIAGVRGGAAKGKL